MRSDGKMGGGGEMQRGNELVRSKGRVIFFVVIELELDADLFFCLAEAEGNQYGL